jgi:periplasmic protein TonB
VEVRRESFTLPWAMGRGLVRHSRVRAARARAIAASVGVHAVLAAAWISVGSRGGGDAPAPSSATVEVRLLAPRPLAAPRAGPHREGRAGRAAGRPRTGGARPPSLRAPPGPAALVKPDALLPAESSDPSDRNDGVAFAGAVPGGFIASRPGAGSSGGSSLAAAPELQALDADWLRRNRRAIERRIQFTMNTLPYPRDARRRGWKGDVVVAFRLRTDGTVRDVRVTRSSGHLVLDACAVEAVTVTPRFPRPPVELDVEIPFEFRLLPG